MRFKRLIQSAALALGLFAPALGAPAPRAFLPTGMGDPLSWGSFVTCVNTIETWVGPNTPDWVFHSSVYDYSARKPLYDPVGRPLLDDRGRQRCDFIHQSGRIFYPPAWRAKGHTRMPIVMYSHATTLLKDAVASDFGGHEWVLGAAAAAYYGFAVAMPDEPGFGGDSSTFHTYCHAKSLAFSILDGIPAVRKQFDRDPFLVQNNYSWNGKLYLLGYSEGGYATLAATREMETHREDYPGARGFLLSGSACMAGPFDISGITRHQILEPATPFAHPFFIPYVVLGYNTVYGNIMNPLEALAPALIQFQEDGNILEWTNGLKDGLVVDEFIAKRMGVPRNRVVLRSLLNPAWVAKELDDPGFQTSPLRDIFKENDVAEGWTPSRPILFCQSPDDQDVPYQNTLKARDLLGAALEKAGWDPGRLLVLKPLGKPGDGISHVAGALVAVPTAFDWIYRGMPSDSSDE